MTATLKPPTDVKLSRDINAPVARVFALWTDRAAMMRWFGMDGFTNLDCAVDPRPGGAWHMESRTPDGHVVRMEGSFLAIEANARIVQDWTHISPDGTRSNTTEVEITFTEISSGTRVTVHHRKIQDTPELFELGWTQSFRRIEAEFSD